MRLPIVLFFLTVKKPKEIQKGSDREKLLILAFEKLQPTNVLQYQLKGIGHVKDLVLIIQKVGGVVREG